MKKNNLTTLIINKNSEKTLQQTLLSIHKLGGRILLIDNYSSDHSIAIATFYHAKVLMYKGENLGDMREFGLRKITTKWVLVVDGDEFPSAELIKEIKSIVGSKKSVYDGYFIPFRTHLFGIPLFHGGENYKKLCLFKRRVVRFPSRLVHEKAQQKKGAKIGQLKPFMYHYSYRSLSQMYSKFTDYGLREGRERYKKNENVSIQKFVLFPIHMFYARFIKDEGYRDGIIRIPLDVGFAYMEFLSYLTLLYLKIRKGKK